MKEVLLGTLVFVAITVALVVGIGSISRLECENVGKRMGLETSWGYFQPCMIKTPSGWRLLDQQRQMEQKP